MKSARDRETSCGLFGWRPDFMQVFASKKVYMFFYGVIGIINGMQYTYLSTMLSTLEKKFGIKSKETAYLMSGNEIAQILFLFFLPITVKAKKRPLWCGIGLAITSFGLFIMCLPHFLTGYNHIDTQVDIDEFTEEEKESQGLCGSSLHMNSLEGACNADGSRVVDWGGLIIMFMGVALTGVGGSLYWCFGIVYLDDNMGKANSPFMLSLTFTARLVGPTLGFLLGGACLGTYVYPGMEVDFNEKDPRWVGAWWIGFPVIALLLLLFSFPLIFFPERLPKTDSDASKENKETEELKGASSSKTRDAFFPALKRLLSNKLFMANFGSTIFFVFAFMGFGTFMPKYIEYQFRTKASSSARASGLAGTMSKAVGFLFSGWLIGRFKFSAKTLAAWNVILGCCYFCTLMVFASLGCSTSHMSGTLKESGDYDVNTGCNSDFPNNCSCPVSRMQPICSKDDLTNFYSPCHAGCKQLQAFEAPTQMQIDGLLRRMDENKDETITIQEFIQGFPDVDSNSKEDAAKMADFYGTLGGRVTIRMLNETLGNLDEEERAMMAGWGLAIHRKEGWRDCSCVAATNSSMSARWLEEASPGLAASLAGEPVSEAVPGWCEVPGCKAQAAYFFITVGVVSILASTGRVGNVLVALRCVEVRDKSLSFGFQTVFMSLFAMLPSPIIYGAIIDNTCLLWQEECGETTNCLLYDTDLLRTYLMYTTAAIMSIGVLFDILVVYYAKDLDIFPEAVVEAIKDEMTPPDPITLNAKNRLNLSTSMLAPPSPLQDFKRDFGSHLSLNKSSLVQGK